MIAEQFGGFVLFMIIVTAVVVFIVAPFISVFIL